MSLYCQRVVEDEMCEQQQAELSFRPFLSSVEQNEFLIPYLRCDMFYAVIVSQ